MVDVVADRVVVELFAKLDQYDRAVANSEANTQRTYNTIMTGGERMEQSLRSSFLGSASAADLLVRSLAAVTTALGAREVMRYADSWVAAGNKISAMGTPLEDQQRRLQQLADVAVATRGNFEGTVQTFARLEMSTKGLGKSQADLLRITETINKAFAVGGAVPSEQFAASLQLSQALSSGILGGDELRSVRENAPVIARAIADVMGTTVGNLKNLGEQGQLTSAVVIEALERLGPEVDKAFGQTVPTISQSIGILQTRLTEFIGTASNTSGAGQVIAGSISMIANNFELLADAAIAVGAVFTGRLAQGMADQVSANGRLRQEVTGTWRAMLESSEASRERAAAALQAAQAASTAAVAEADLAATNAARLRQDLEILAVERAKAQQYLAAQITENGRRMQTAALIEIRQSEIALTRQLSAAEMTLAEARAVEMTATARATAAQGAYNTVMAATTLRALAWNAAMKVVQGTLAFFGGPIGFAITGLSVAMLILANSSDKVAEATNRAKESEDDFWKVVDRTTLKIQAQNKELVENQRQWNAKVVRDNGSVISGGVNDLTIGGSRDLPNVRHTWAGNMASDQLAISREADALISKFKAAGDYSADAFLRLENSLLSLQRRWPGFGERTLEQVKNLRKLAQESDGAAARLAILDGKATDQDKKKVLGGVDALGDTSPLFTSSGSSTHTDAFTKAVKAVQERTASLQVESQVAGKSVFEQEKAKAALELRTAAEDDLKRAQDKRAQNTSKSAEATKKADAELAAAKTLHDQRISQVDALAEALARQAAAADKAKKSAGVDKRESSESRKNQQTSALADTQTAVQEANRQVVRANGEMQTAMAGDSTSFYSARMRQVRDDAAAQIEVIKSKEAEEIASLAKIKGGWKDYEAAINNIKAATKSQTDAINTKRDADITRELISGTQQEAQAMRDEIATMGMTREGADRLLRTKQLLAIASEAEKNGLQSVADAARKSAEDYNAASEGLERVREANDHAVQASDSLRDSVKQTIVNFKDAKSAAASFISVLANSAADDVVEAIFGKRGTPIGGKPGGGQSTGGGILGTVWDLAKTVIPGFANGTNSAPAGLALVGERGPELVNLPGGSQVIPDVGSLANRVTAGVQNNSLSYTNFGGNILVNGDTDSRSLRLMKAMLDHSEAQFDSRWLAMFQKFNRNK